MDYFLFKLRRALRRLEHLLFRLFPKWFIPKRLKERTERKILEDEDININSKSELDLYRSLGIVVVEYYTSHHTRSLFRKLDRNGWRLMGSGGSLSEWLRTSRQSLGGAWANLPLVVSGKIKKDFRGDSIVSKNLPDCFSSVSIKFVQLTPTLTASVTLFKLTDENRNKLVEAINEDHFTIHKPLKGLSYSIVGPRAQKEEAVAEIREQWAIRARRWIKRTMPGATSLDTKSVLPKAWELGSTKREDPWNLLAAAKQKSAPDRALGFDQSWAVWHEADAHGIQMLSNWRSNTAENLPKHFGLLVSSQRALDSLRSEYYAEGIYALFERYELAFVELGLHELLLGYSEILSEMRDRIAPERTTESAFRYLRTLRATHAVRMDISMTIAELQKDKKLNLYYSELPELLQSINDGNENQENQFSDSFNKNIKVLLEYVSAQNKGVGRLVTERLSYESSLESIKLNRSAIFVAVLALLVSVLVSASRAFSELVRISGTYLF